MYAHANCAVDVTLKPSLLDAGNFSLALKASSSSSSLPSCFSGDQSLLLQYQQVDLNTYAEFRRRVLLFALVFQVFLAVVLYFHLSHTW